MKVIVYPFFISIIFCRQNGPWHMDKTTKSVAFPSLIISTWHHLSHREYDEGAIFDPMCFESGLDYESYHVMQTFILCEWDHSETQHIIFLYIM